MADILSPVGVVRGSLRTYFFHWPLAFFCLGLLPWAWAELLELIVRASLTTSLKDQTPLFDGVVLLWASLLLAPQIAVALALSREQPIRAKPLLQAVRRVPHASAVQMLLMTGYFLGGLCVYLSSVKAFQSMAVVLSVAGIVCTLGTVFLYFRCFTAIPIVVDRQVSVLAALRASWRYSAGLTAWQLRIVACVVPAILLAVVLTVAFPPYGVVAWPVLSPWLILAWARAYTQIVGGDRPKARSAGPTTTCSG